MRRILYSGGLEDVKVLFSKNVSSAGKCFYAQICAQKCASTACLTPASFSMSQYYYAILSGKCVYLMIHKENIGCSLRRWLTNCCVFVSAPHQVEINLYCTLACAFSGPSDMSVTYQLFRGLPRTKVFLPASALLPCQQPQSHQAPASHRPASGRQHRRSYQMSSVLRSYILTPPQVNSILKANEYSFKVCRMTQLNRWTSLRVRFCSVTCRCS